MMLRRMMMATASGGGGGVAESILAKAQLWWTFDGSLVDSVASSTLTPFASTTAYTPGKKGNAVQTLRASTAEAVVSGFEASGFTLCGWLRLTDTNSRVLFALAVSGPGGEVVAFDNVSGGIGANYRNGAGFATINRIPAANGQWCFFDLSWIPGSGSTGQVVFSLNRANTQAATKNKGSEVSGPYFQLGSIYSSTFSGCDLDEVLFSQGPLTPDELDWLYNAGAGRSYAEVTSGV